MQDAMKSVLACWLPCDSFSPTSLTESESRVLGAWNP
jgi:hypothetical protein